MAKITFMDFLKPIVVALVIASFAGLLGFIIEFNYMRNEIKKINEKLDVSKYENDEVHRAEIRLLEKTLLVRKIESLEQEIQGRKDGKL